MKFKFWLSLQSYLFISSIRPSHLAEPFTFNPYSLQIRERASDMLNENFKGPYAVACPLDTKNKTENKILQKKSLDGKGLLVQRYYDLPTVQLDHSCEKNFELSAVYLIDDDEDGNQNVIEFGYEVFFRRNQLPEVLQRVPQLEKYAPISCARSFCKQIAHDTRHPDHSNDGNKLEFIWIEKIEIQYNVKLWNILDIRYTMHRNVYRQLKVKCNDHNLGIKLYNKKHGPFDEFYSVNNQRKIFANVQLPESDSCQSTYECVKKYDLLTPYHFEPYPGSLVSCSNLTTIPVWHERTEELLNNLERFLIAIAQVTENELTVLPGVFDVLSLPKKNSRGSEPIPMYLYPKKERIPIPRIIHKVVRYKSYNCDSYRTLCWFDVIIVIHNEPKFSEEGKLCPKDMSTEWGWERIKFTKTSATEENGSEYIYCCEFDEKLRDMLNYEPKSDVIENLKLNHFPVYDKVRKDHEYQNKKAEFEEAMKQLEIQLET